MQIQLTGSKCPVTRPGLESGLETMFFLPLTNLNPCTLGHHVKPASQPAPYKVRTWEDLIFSDQRLTASRTQKGPRSHLGWVWNWCVCGGHSDTQGKLLEPDLGDREVVATEATHSGHFTAC